MSLPEVTIYTDGACSPNPGTGGWGAVVLSEGRLKKEISGCEEETTNNRMELTAALRGLQALSRSHRVTVVTDSTYVKNGISSWIHDWRRRGWRTADNRPVKNRDLWQSLAEEIKRHELTWRWVKGHANDQWNNRVDALAVTARKRNDRIAPTTTAAESTDNRIRLYSGITYASSRRGGSWAVLLAYRQHVKVIGGVETCGSANQLHLRSAIEGLSALKRYLPVTVYTTSCYLRDGVDRWLAGWLRRNWSTHDGQPVCNQTLWQQLALYIERYEVEVQVVQRKGGFCLMQEAKELARQWQDTI